MGGLVVPADAPHLGGYIAGGDDATAYPDLWKWLVTDHGVRSVLDVGCGDGVAVRAFRGLGCHVRGIDGVAQGDPDIICHDYTTGFADLEGCVVCGHGHAPAFNGFDPSGPCGADRCSCTVGRLLTYDLVWSCEFVEHVDDRYVPNFLESFRRAPLVLMTHAWPGQQGHHHVNCRQADYWIGVMAAAGYRWDYDMTTLTRAVAAINASEWNHYARSGLAFRRN